MKMNSFRIEKIHTTSAVRAIQEAVITANETSDYKFPEDVMISLFRKSGYNFIVRQDGMMAESKRVGRATHFDFRFRGNRMHVLVIKESNQYMNALIVYQCRKTPLISAAIISKKLTKALEEGKDLHYADYACATTEIGNDVFHVISHRGEEYRFRCEKQDIGKIVSDYINKTRGKESMLNGV